MRYLCYNQLLKLTVALKIQTGDQSSGQLERFYPPYLLVIFYWINDKFPCHHLEC